MAVRNIVFTFVVCGLFSNCLISQGFDSISFEKYELKPKVIVLPSSMVFYGYSSFFIPKVRDWDLNLNSKLKKSKTYSIDDFIIYTPLAADLGLTLAGYKSKHKYQDKIGLYFISTLINTSLVYPVKSISDRERPNSVDFKSFPSGHTSNAFVGAEFFWQEYNHKSKWLALSGYFVAGATGYFRLQNNEHWFSDVITGAGIGILSTKLSYWLYPKIYQFIFPNSAKNRPMVAMKVI